MVGLTDTGKCELQTERSPPELDKLPINGKYFVHWVYPEFASRTWSWVHDLVALHGSQSCIPSLQAMAWITGKQGFLLP